jgi:transketolase
VASAVIGIDHFGASGDGTEVVQQAGFTVDNIVEQFKAKLAEAEVK